MLVLFFFSSLYFGVWRREEKAMQEYLTMIRKPNFTQAATRWGKIRQLQELKQFLLTEPNQERAKAIYWMSVDGCFFFLYPFICSLVQTIPLEWQAYRWTLRFSQLIYSCTATQTCRPILMLFGFLFVDIFVVFCFYFCRVKCN